MDSTVAVLIGVGITALVSIVLSWVNHLNTKQTLRHGAMREFSKISLEYKTQQLNAFYGPLSALLEQNKRLAKKLREGKGDPEKWRLFDNLPEVLNNDQDRAIVNDIMEIDAKVEALIINNAGLIHTPIMPESFNIFLGHYRTLKLAIQGEGRHTQAEFWYYPRELNTVVKEAIEAIQQERADILRRYES